jgi:polyisoprenoid-binding protein YceI
MEAASGHRPAPVLQALLTDGTLAGDWALDPRRSSVGLRTRVLGLIPVHGVFREVTGEGAVYPDGGISGTVAVAAASIDTKNARRDTHLRSADFFDTGNKPDITFSAEAVRLTAEGVAFTGTLTVRDQTRPLSFVAATSVQGDGEIRIDADVHINRADFGLTWNPMGMVSMHSVIAVHAVFVRQ